jgi:hypothetical protein
VLVALGPEKPDQHLQLFHGGLHVQAMFLKVVVPVVTTAFYT